MEQACGYGRQIRKSRDKSLQAGIGLRLYLNLAKQYSNRDEIAGFKFFFFCLTIAG
jgi:hypothetical protein